MQLRVTDGTTTVDLSGATAGVRGCTYFPQPGTGQESVSETAEVIGAGTAAQIRAAVAALERLLGAAARRQASRLGTRIFVEYKPVASDALYRSELYGGRVTWSEEPGARQLGWPNPVVKYALLLERAPWWEGPEAELALTASGQPTPATGGRTLTNNGIDNWVQAASVEGSLPAPVRLQVANASAGSVAWAEFYWGLNTFANPTSFGHLLQGENQEAGYGTDGPSGECSGGLGNTVTVTSTGAWRNAWLLPTTMTAAGGRWFRLVLRVLPGAATQLKLRVGLFDHSGLIPLWQGQEVTWDGGYDLIDLGAAPIPPGPWASSYGPVLLKIWSETATGSYGLLVDYLALLGSDGWRRATTVGMLWAPGDAVVVDEIEGTAYGLSGTTRYPYLVMGGEPLLLFPGQTNRLVQLEASGNYAGSVSHSYSVRIWYRPRRSTV